MLIASVNIEPLHNVGQYPDAFIDKIDKIYTTFSYYGQQCHLKHIITTSPISPISPIQNNNCVIEYYKKEKQALLAWGKLIGSYKIDVLIGYSLFNYDLEYMRIRSELLNCSDKLMNSSKIFTRTKIYNVYENERIFYSPNMNIICLYKYIQKNYKLQSYTFSYVYNYFMNEKIPNVQLSEMTECFNKLLVYLDMFLNV